MMTENIDINIFNKDYLKLLKHSNNDNYYTLHLEFKTYPIKLITDFDTYCYASSIIDNIGLDKFNLNISFKNKDTLIIIEELNNNILINENNKLIINDPFHFLLNKVNIYDKTDIDYTELLKLFSSRKDMNQHLKNIKNIDNLLLSPKQIIQLLVNEIKKFNSNKDHKHFITVDHTNVFSLIVNLEFENKVELRLIVDPDLYPLVPPKIEYVKPNVKFELLFSINNLDILQLKNWSTTINLEYLITNLADRLEPIIKDFIIDKVYENELDHEIIKLTVLLKDNIDNKIK